MNQTFLTSRDNALVKELRRLAQDNTAYRRQGRVWIEGDHLCRALLARGLQPALLVATEGAALGVSTWGLADTVRCVVVPGALWDHISSLESPASVACVFDLPVQPELDPAAPTVVLDRVQDAGNVGSILRSAAAFGYTQVLALTGTAALWSPKVLRAGMGAHFGLRLVEGLQASALSSLTIPLLATSSHQGEYLHRADLPWPCAWAFGHEGQGVADDIQALARAHLRIAQPGGEESLNVAAAAAICLHTSAAPRL